MKSENDLFFSSEVAETLGMECALILSQYNLEKFGNINHNPDDKTSRINVYTNWLKANKKTYHNLQKIHIKNLMKVLKGKELSDKDVPESFVILREGEEDIEKPIMPKTSCGC